MHTNSDFERQVQRWQDIPGWFQWRDAQEEAIAHFEEIVNDIELDCCLTTDPVIHSACVESEED